MLETVPAAVEIVIYLYILLVGAVGCYLQRRLWIGPRRGETDDASSPN